MRMVVVMLANDYMMVWGGKDMLSDPFALSIRADEQAYVYGVRWESECTQSLGSAHPYIDVSSSYLSPDSLLQHVRTTI